MPKPLNFISNSPRASSSSLPTLDESKPFRCAKCLSKPTIPLRPCDDCIHYAAASYTATKGHASKGRHASSSKHPRPSKASTSATKSVLGKRKPEFPHDLQTRPAAILKTNTKETNHTSRASKSNKTNVNLSSAGALTTLKHTHSNGSSSSAAIRAATLPSRKPPQSVSRCFEYQCQADMLFVVQQSLDMFQTRAATAAVISQEHNLSFKGYYSIIEDPKMSLKARAREVLNELKVAMGPMRFGFVKSVELNAEKCTQVWNCQCNDCLPVPSSVTSVTPSDPSTLISLTSVAPVKKAKKQATLAGWVKKPSTSDEASPNGNTSDIMGEASRCGFLKIIVQADKSHKLYAKKAGKGILGRKITIEFQHPRKGMSS